MRNNLRKFGCLVMVFIMVFSFMPVMNVFGEGEEYTEDLTFGKIFSSSGTYSSNTANLAFDDNFSASSNSWIAAGDTNQWVGIDFGDPKNIGKITLVNGDGIGSNTYRCQNFKIQYSDNDSTWNDAYSGILPSDYTKHEYTFNSVGAHRYWRLFIINTYPLGTPLAGICEIEMMEKIESQTPSTSIDIQSIAQVEAGAEFTADVLINNATDIYAEDITINYDTTLFEYVSASAVGGLNIEYQNQLVPGTIKFIISSPGEVNVINGQAELLQLTFRAKNVAGTGVVAPLSGIVANGDGVESEAICNGTSIIVYIIDCDINGDGRYTLGDLAIASKNVGKANTEWTNIKVDVNHDGVVDLADLTIITTKIISSI